MSGHELDLDTIHARWTDDEGRVPVDVARLIAEVRRLRVELECLKRVYGEAEDECQRAWGRVEELEVR